MLECHLLPLHHESIEGLRGIKLFVVSHPCKEPKLEDPPQPVHQPCPLFRLQLAALRLSHHSTSLAQLSSSLVQGRASSAAVPIIARSSMSWCSVHMYQVQDVEWSTAAAASIHAVRCHSQIRTRSISAWLPVVADAFLAANPSDPGMLQGPCPSLVIPLDWRRLARASRIGRHQIKRRQCACCGFPSSIENDDVDHTARNETSRNQTQCTLLRVPPLFFHGTNADSSAS